ncbi:hypothetical protein LIER_04827 [Lithospermum erythrorhizon]|uniref:RING-type domain-containing protein n=1 Tax=Lithospermum erythrorhizon TaxID=34254 RepID=A0AAV3NYE6_LITER
MKRNESSDANGGFMQKRMKTDMHENMGGSNTSCHPCKRIRIGRNISCNKCKKNYCTGCKNKWYPHMSEDDLSEACPLCRNNCNCTFCLGRTNNLENLMLELTQDEKLK